jgi:hypothetical protein
MRKIFIALSLVFPMLGHTEDKFGETQTFFKYGVGVFKSANRSAVEVKTISVGRQRPLGYYMIYQYEVGGWMDTRDDAGRKSSGFANVATGINLNIGPMYAQSLWGVALITNTDSYLGGHEQFNEDLAIGIKDWRGVGLGINYKHISSAGLWQPNMGRDMMSVKLNIPW